MGEYLWVMLKWRGPSSLTRGRSVHVRAEIAELEPDEQLARMRHVAMQAKPNPAWRLAEYQIEGRETVVIEGPPRRQLNISLPFQVWRNDP